MNLRAHLALLIGTYILFCLYINFDLASFTVANIICLRRLAAIDKKRDSRMDKFIKVAHTKFNVDEDMFEQEEKYIANLRQFVVFRDIASIVMKKLAAAAMDSATYVPLPGQIQNGYRQVRVSLTAPTMSPRQLGISMVSRYILF